MTAGILLLWLILGSGAHATAQAQVEKYQSAQACGRCHEERYRQWRGSGHSQAAENSIFRGALQILGRDDTGRHASTCISCHAPTATAQKQVRWPGRVSDEVNLSPVAREGITCDFCHTISGREFNRRELHASIYRVTNKASTAVKYGRNADAQRDDCSNEPSEFLQSSDFCGMCHRVVNPSSNRVLQDTYAEWLHSSYSARGRTCQNCHMPKYPGQQTAGSRERPELSAHEISGKHSALISGAATISLRAKVRQGPRRNRIDLSAYVTNEKAGHLMPTGIPGMRRLWLDLSVTGSDGTQMFARSVVYEATLLDAAGRRSLPWNAQRLGTDTRLAPMKTSKSVFEIEVPGGYAGTLVVEGTLKYQRRSEWAASMLETEPSPSITVARDRLLIHTDGTVQRALQELQE